MGNPIPTQTRSVDPYASYNSNVVNALTRMISNGEDVILASFPIRVEQLTTTTARVSEGKCIKDDVFIEIQQIDIDFTDVDYYVSPGGSAFLEDGMYYIVLDYAYAKSKPAPVASIKIIKPSQRTNPAIFNSAAHMLLKVFDATSNILLEAYDYDPEIPTNQVRRSQTTSYDPRFPTGDYNTSIVDQTIFADGNSTITLPLAAVSHQVTIINEDGAGPVTVNTSYTDTIEGASSVTVPQIYDSITFMSDGTSEWIRITTPLSSVSPAGTPVSPPVGPYSMTLSDDGGYIMAFGGSTITILTAAAGNMVRIINKDGLAPVIVNAAGGETIEGNASITLTSLYDAVTIISDKSNTWFEV